MKISITAREFIGNSRELGEALGAVTLKGDKGQTYRGREHIILNKSFVYYETVLSHENTMNCIIDDILASWGGIENIIDQTKLFSIKELYIEMLVEVDKVNILAFSPDKMSILGNLGCKMLISLE